MHLQGAVYTAVIICFLEEFCLGARCNSSYYTKTAVVRVQTGEPLLPVWGPYLKEDISLGYDSLYYHLPVFRSYVNHFRRTELLGHREVSNSTHCSYTISCKTTAAYKLILKLFDTVYDYTDVVLKFDSLELFWNTSFTVTRLTGMSSSHGFKWGPLPNVKPTFFAQSVNGLAAESLSVLAEMSKKVLKKHFPSNAVREALLQLLRQPYPV